MNILWIEDFGGGLSSGTDTLELFFKEFVDFDLWTEDELSLLSRPSDLPKFCKQTESSNCIYLCRNYFDYEDFKKEFDILLNIDTVIIDIRLDNNINLDRAIPDGMINKSKFHEEGGFYIFNDLVNFGFPSQKICLMTGESGKLDFFNARLAELYIPKVNYFLKKKDEEKLRDWLKTQNTDYTKLRRGVVDGCEYLKRLAKQDDDNIQFRDFIKIENKQPAIEIPTNEIENYLDVLMTSLDVRAPSEENSINNRYRLFLRALCHEWEENIEANSFKEKFGNNLNNIRDIYTFAWIMKMTRNWVAHAKLLEPLNAQFIAFLFLINMRAMFRLPKAIQSYEQTLLHCISLSPVSGINIASVQDVIKLSEENVDDLLIRMNNIHTDEKSSFILTYENKTKILKYFNDKINEIYRYNTGQRDAEDHDFKQLLFQYFWINQKQEIKKFVASSNEFLPTLARHIYKHSFP